MIFVCTSSSSLIGKCISKDKLASYLLKSHKTKCDHWFNLPSLLLLYHLYAVVSILNLNMPKPGSSKGF